MMWEAVGLDERESRVYEAVARHGHVTAPRIAAEVALSNTQVSRTLARLANRGLLTRLSGRPARFAAVAPEQVAASLIAEQQRQLLDLRAHARQLGEVHRRASVAWHHPADLIQVLEGPANVRNAFRRLQQEAQHQFRGFDRPPYLNNPLDGNDEEDRRLTSREITYRVIYDRSALAMPGRMADIWNGIHLGEQARVGDVPMKMMLCDDRSALIPVATAGSGYSIDAAYLIWPSSLLDALSALFEALWERAVPVNRVPKVVGAGDLPDEDVDLIGLLVAGNTDETIAHTMGWHVRTVSRHVHQLMDRVGAQTRFQLGMEAVRRDWV
jgi:DNA-binding CsgD family transcriptional regulator/DNA-binding Lrp family transcriptional regulator